MKLLELNDRRILEDYLRRKEHFLSYYSFVNLYIWKSLFKIYYLKIRDCLCVFFKDKVGLFMVLPPLGEINKDIVLEAFEIMDKKNEDKNISRIEGVEEEYLDFYKSLGFKFKLKDKEYILLREDLVSLKGNNFKSKRYSYNYFLRNYRFQYLNYNSDMRKDCINLYQRWGDERKKKYSDPIYQKMLEDYFSCLKIALKNYEELDLTGKVIKIEDNLCGFSFGFSLNEETFCIQFEITDLKYKGISQFIFTEFSKELKYKYINIMGDCGLENLRKTKLSYHPTLEIPEYIITR